MQSLDKIAILLGNPNGNFTYTPTLDVIVGDRPQFIAVGDFNGDGNQDLAVANITSSTVSIRLGDGNGGFTNPLDVPNIGSNPQCIAVGDFNGDCKQDLAIALYSIDKIAIRIGDGLGGFSGTTNVSVGGEPYSVVIGDFNNDGNQDLAVANSKLNDNRVSIRLGNGIGGFPNTLLLPYQEVPVGIKPRDVVIGKFNNDLFQDIATANALTNPPNTPPYIVSIHLGGSGGFIGTPNVSVGTDPWSLAVGDFNGDSKQDIVAANVSDDNVSIRVGNGLGGFSGTTNVGVGDFPFSIAVGDFNNDGIMDIATANSGDHTITILKGMGVTVTCPTNITVCKDAGPITLSGATPSGGVYSGNFVTAGVFNPASATLGTHTITYTYPSMACSYSCTFTITVLNPCCVAPPSDMVGWWTGDNSIKDLALISNAGKLENGATYGPGKVKNSFSLDGIDDYVNVKHHTELNFGTGDFSIDAWINPQSITGVKPVVEKRQMVDPEPFPAGYLFYLENGELKFSMTDPTNGTGVYSSGAIIPISTWSHVTVTVNRAPNGGRFYVNGMIVGTPFTPKLGNINSSVSLKIGRNVVNQSGQNYFDGKIDEVEIFTRKLTYPEIFSIFAADISGKCKPNPYIEVYTGGLGTCVNGTLSLTSTTIFVTPDSRLIFRVWPSGVSPVIGNINACVTLDAVQMTYNGSPYVQRHYDIVPAVNPSTSTGTITLFFSDAEFVNYNSNNPTWPALPTLAGGGSTDPNRANLRFTQFLGTPTSSPTAPGFYTGTKVLLDPADENIIYDEEDSIWSVTIDVTGFSGFYVHTTRVVMPVKVFLQGAYTSGSIMKPVTASWAAILNANALNQPYNSAPFNYTGTESVSPGFFTSTGATTDIVDWVLLELRNAATPATVVARRAALLRRNGRVVDLDGVSDVHFNNVNTANYHLVIRHRNHLAIRTSVTTNLDASLGAVAPAPYDYPAAQANAFQNVAITTNPAQRDLTGGVFGMWGGNGNSDGAVRATGPPVQNDYLNLLTALGNNPSAIISNVYNRADINMDGTIRASGLPSINDYLFLLNALDNNPAKIVSQHQ